MKQFLIYFAILGTAWVLQSFLTLFQVKNFSGEIVSLRKQGRIVIGKSKGGFYAGTLLILVLGDNDSIINGKKMQGVTVFSRMKEFTDFNNMTLDELKKNQEELGLNKGMKKALESIFSGGV